MASVEEEGRTLRTSGAFGLMFFLLAQVFQEIARRLAPAPVDELTAFLGELHPLQRARSALVLLSFFGLYAGFLTIGLARVRKRPGAIALALSFLGIFCATEIFYRSADFFAVEGAWLRRYAASTDPAQRAILRSHVEAFGDVVKALYAPLMLLQLFGSALIAFAFVPAKNADRWIVGGFAFNTLRLTGRFAASYLGQSWLSSLGGELYFPTVLLSYAPMLAWAMSSTRSREL